MVPPHVHTRIVQHVYKGCRSLLVLLIKNTSIHNQCYNRLLRRRYYWLQYNINTYYYVLYVPTTDIAQYTRDVCGVQNTLYVAASRWSADHHVAPGMLFLLFTIVQKQYRPLRKPKTTFTACVQWLNISLSHTRVYIMISINFYCVVVSRSDARFALGLRVGCMQYITIKKILRSICVLSNLTPQIRWNLI